MLVAAILGLFISLAAHANDPFRDLVTMDGQEIASLPQTEDGKWTLVMLWATDCHACELQKPDIAAFSEKHKDGKISVVGIAIDGRDNIEKVQAHQAHKKDGFPTYIGEYLLLSTNIELVAGEALRGTPTYLMLDENNNIKAYNPGMLNMDDLDAYVARNVYGE